jgi:hypothetical protein
MDVRGLLDAEEAGWRRLNACLARVPPARFEEPGVTPEGWSPKDVVFHVGGWLAECADILDRIRVGTYDPSADVTEFDAVNREWFERSRRMEGDDVRVGCESARQRARKGFASMPAPSAEAWEWFEESGPLHYAKHVNDLEAWLG